MTISSIWYKQPSILLMLPYDFFPSNTMSIEETLNSIVRLSFYVCFIMGSLGNLDKGLFIVSLSLIFTYLLHIMHKDVTIKDRNDIFPTADNPFMNIQLHEYSSTSVNKNKHREIQKVYDRGIEDTQMKHDIKEKFNMSTDDMNFKFNTADNVFGRNTSERQFYTVPVTTIPSQQNKFADWLYGHKGETCKENNSAC